VTFKEVRHLLESQPDYTTSQQSEMLQRVRGKPFYIWDSALHKEKGRTHRGDCCFNDIIGLPKKSSAYPQASLSVYGLRHLPRLALTAMEFLHPLASASCPDSTISTATTGNSPKAVSKAKITTVVCVSMFVL
jgi:hypothetical protein